MKTIITIPAIPMRGITVFPGMPVSLPLGRRRSIEAAYKASEGDGRIFLVSQKDASVEVPSEKDMCPVGVIAHVIDVSKDKNVPDAVRIIADGVCRAEMYAFHANGSYYTADITAVDEKWNPEPGTPEAVQKKAFLLKLRHSFDMFCDYTQPPRQELADLVYGQEDLSVLTDAIAAAISYEISQEECRGLLENSDVFSRATELSVILDRLALGLSYESEINEKVQERMDKNQREYWLHEEMKVITDELDALYDDDSTGLKKKIAEAKLTDEARQKLNDELARLKKFSSNSADAAVCRTYIEKCLEIPWGTCSSENSDIEKAKKVLDRDHYGLTKVKERITEMLASRIISKEIKGQIICLAGPPGVGKTSIAKSVAAASGRVYTRIALGGMRDESEIRGHRRTYVGAMPGRVVNALTEAKTMNPLILFDEIDKLSSGGFSGDPSAALLEVLDGEQNSRFRDNFIELPVDLSQVLFMTTANDISDIPAPLRDRMEIIELPGYTYEEKFNIAKKHLVPKQLKEHGLTKSDLKISDAALREIVDGWTREAGVRILERQIAKLCRKQALRIAEGNTGTLNVKPAMLEQLLGVRRYRSEDNSLSDETGVVNGLAWTSVGGEVLRTEAAVLSGKGAIELTGCLGDVMKESAKIAVSLVRSRADKYGIDPEFYTKKDIHLHFPEGAVPKDGPSAGVTITTALVSALSGRKVRGDVAMTGEITLRGKVLSIGGLREKSMGAYKEGIKTVIIPDGNVPDLEDVDDVVKQKVKFIPAKTIDDVLSAALV